jgi:hypothetical protein
MQTDIKINNRVLNTLGKMVEVQISNDLSSITKMRRAQIVINEFVDMIFLGDQHNHSQYSPAGSKLNGSYSAEVVLTSMQMIKTLLIYDPD